eukprot:156297-Chlamydomonas_euryale.AAC.1
MVHRRTLQWMGHVQRMDEDRLPRQVFDCSSARSAAKDGRVEQLKLQKCWRFFWDVQLCNPGCYEESSSGGTTFGTSSNIRAAAAERALATQAWRDAIKNLAPLEFKNPQQVGRMTRSRCVMRLEKKGSVTVTVAVTVFCMHTSANARHLHAGGAPEGGRQRRCTHMPCCALIAR